jgi:lysophospholipase L1-like esterase
MRTLILALLAIVLVTPTASAADPVIETSAGSSWYLALGDSLAAGYQPIGDPAADHRTRASYPDQLWLMARQQYPDLQLRNLGCPGETTATMRIAGERCLYEHGSQLHEALAFIEAHLDELAFISIDIGFNDFACEDALRCLFPGIDSIEARLPSILAELQAAAPGVPIVGMNIYDPFLTYWLVGDEVLARQSVEAIRLINEALGDVYAKAGIPVADVETAFAIGDWETLVPMAGHGDVPLNVALLCQRTWQCHAPPLGPDRHPNVLGFRAMAEAFARELGLEPASMEFVGDPG